MKKAKIKSKVKKQEVQKAVEETYSIKKLLLIILTLVAIFTVFYIITTLTVKPKNDTTTYNSTAVIDSEMIILSHLLDRKESEYYVLATKPSKYSGITKNNYIELYNKYIVDYKNTESSLTFYKVDLDDALNKNFISSETNITDKIEDLKLSDEALFKIKDAKIEASYVGSKEILTALANL